MSDGYPSDEEIGILNDSVSRFGSHNISDNWRTWYEQRETPRSYIQRLGDAGYLGADLPEIYGGSNASFAYSAELIRAFCKQGHFVYGGMLISQIIWVAHLLDSHRVSKHIKDRFLPRLVSGEIIPAMAITEPQGGSDLLGVRCKAEFTDNYYTINGSKTFISNVNIADIFIVIARTSAAEVNRKGLSIFLVDAKTPGVEIGRPLEKIGMHTSNTAELFFNDVKVSSECVLGEIDQGLPLLLESMQRERCYVGICATGICEWALNLTRDHVNERKLFGKPLGEMQNTRFELAQMYAEWKIFDAYVHQAIEQMNQDSLSPRHAAVVRLMGVQTVTKIVDKCALLFGGYGYMAEYPIAQLWTDVRGMAFWGGTSEIMKEIIARDFLSA